MEDGRLKLEYCPTEDMVADGLTKALGPERHKRLTRIMGMEKWQDSEDYAITKAEMEEKEEGDGSRDGGVTEV